MKIEETVIGDRSAKHAYDVEVGRGKTIKVYANTRNQAAKIAREQGFPILSVNMIG